jgi:uncharacterized protein YdeI (BOF family)
MKKILLIAAAVALMAAPAFAQSQGSEELKSQAPAATTGQGSQAAQPKAVQPKAAPAQRGPNDVFCGNDYLGADPSATVREQMKRDYKHECE